MTARPERVAAEEVRQRMLDAGRELALEAGAALTIEHLRLEEVIQRARVPRSSAYRLWPYKEDYIDDLLCYLAGAGSWFSDRTVVDPATLSLVQQLLAANKALLDTPEGRRALLREVVRVTAERNYTTLSESAQWRLQMALVATLGSTRAGEARRKIAAALEDAQGRARVTMVAVFGYLAGEIGLRVRDPALTVEHMQLAGGLLVQGLALRNVQVQAARGGSDGACADASYPVVAHVDALLNAPVPGPALDGGTAPWSLAAFAYLGIVESFVELDPDFTPSPTLELASGSDAS
jgi:AcrR family transcriptional regulator